MWRTLGFNHVMGRDDTDRGARMTHRGVDRDLKRKRPLVSVVEDDPHFRESMKKLLTSLGYKVEVFASAADFLASRHLRRAACLIADINMRFMTGVELYAHLVERGDAIPTILMTAYVDVAVRDKALKDGVIGYLRKPIDEEHLKRCLRAAIGPGELGRQLTASLPLPMA